MAAIDFPSTPTVGQTVIVGQRIWTWDGDVWASASTRDFVRRISDTAPSDPVVGDEWFNSETGRLYAYYDSYWIEIGASVSGQDGATGADGADGPAGPAGIVDNYIQPIFLMGA
jgi:hypothetical protein